MTGTTIGTTAAPGTVAIMQPYFIPYAGYFRLFAASETFVIYDCVQFPRRGWVHRNKLIDTSGAERWLTLPLVGAPQTVLIHELEFPLDAAELLSQRLRPFPMLQKAPKSAEPIIRALMHVSGTPLLYIERLLKEIAEYLHLPWNVLRSSSLKIPQSHRGQDRIIEIVRRLGARHYVNAPGGRDLYSRDTFAEAGIELSFMSDYAGPTCSVLNRIVQEDRDNVASEIRTTARIGGR
jgi:WbqC-like protein family